MIRLFSPRHRRRLRVQALLGAAVFVLGLIGMTTIARPVMAATDTATVVLSSPYISSGGRTVTATVTAAILGVAAPGETAQWTTTGDASISPTSCTTNTSGQCQVTITAGSVYGTQTVTAVVSGTGFSASGNASLLQYEAPNAVSVSVANSRITPNGVAATTVSLVASDTTTGRTIPGQVVGFSTTATSFPVIFGSQTSDHGNGTYTDSVTAPSFAALQPSQYLEPSQYMVADQSQSESIIGAIQAHSLSGSTSLQLAYPTLHTVQYPNGMPSGSSQPGLYDDQGRYISLRGAEGFNGWYGTSPNMFTNYNGTPVSNSTWQTEVSHMALSQISGANSYAWGLNIVRITLTDSYWLSGDTADGCGQPYQSEVDSLVNMVTADGMIADLDLHFGIDGYSPSTTQPSALPCVANTSAGHGQIATAGQPSMLPMADAYATTFWSSVSERYGDPSSTYYNPLVMFDLYNEPDLTRITHFLNGADAVQVWQQGGYVLTPNSNVWGSNYYYQAAGMDQMYQAVRNPVQGVTVTTPVIVSGVGPDIASVTPTNPQGDGTSQGFDISPVVAGDQLANPPTSAPVLIGDPSQVGTAGSNIVYSSHPYYSGIGSVGADCALTSTTGDGDSTDLGNVVAPVAAEYPVMFGEMGSNCSNSSEGENAVQYNITWEAQHGLIGYVQWNWSAATNSNGFGMLDCDALSCPTGSPYQPNNIGLPEFNGGGSTLN